MSRPYRVTFGSGAFLLGATITVLLFGFPHGATGYVFGILAALLLGMPLALATGMLMRPVRDQWLHIVATGGAGLVTGFLTLLFLTGTHWHSMWGLVLWTGFCAAAGRLAVVGLVDTHDDSELTEPVGPTPDGRIVP
jgi:hypothetical protein